MNIEEARQLPQWTDSILKNIRRGGEASHVGMESTGNPEELLVLAEGASLL